MRTEKRLIISITALVLVAAMAFPALSTIPAQAAPTTLTRMPTANGDVSGTWNIGPRWDTESSLTGWGLSNISFVGDDGDSSTSDSTATIVLDPGESVTLTFTNTQVTPQAPEISLTKTATDGAANEIAETCVGDTIVYLFEVENTGSVDLINVTLTDDTGICDGAISGPTGDGGDGKLNPGETWTYTCSHLVTDDDPDPLENTATVSGQDEQGVPAEDSDTAIVDILNCLIGDTVFYDNNGNGMQDVGEAGISGVQLNLYRDDGNDEFNPSGGTDELVDSDTSHGSGYYEFTGLDCVEMYWIDVVDSSLPSGLTLTAGSDPCGLIGFYPEAEIQVLGYDDVDFGYQPAQLPPTSVGGEAYPVNKLAILVPWIALFAAVMIAAETMPRRRRARR